MIWRWFIDIKHLRFNRKRTINYYSKSHSVRNYGILDLPTSHVIYSAFSKFLRTCALINCEISSGGITSMSIGIAFSFLSKAYSEACWTIFLYRTQGNMTNTQSMYDLNFYRMCRFCLEFQGPCIMIRLYVSANRDIYTLERIGMHRLHWGKKLS